MRRILHALIVATAATAVLIGGAHADTIGVSEATVRGLGMYATVVKDFGATIRVAPSLEAPAMLNTACGAVWPVQLVEGGWVKVRTELGAGWIGGGRVAVATTPQSVDCSDARFLVPSGYVSTRVSSGCLSLRTRPSGEASSIGCVGNGHVYTVVDGPFDAGTDEDWFKVTSPATGTGWTLAENLFPL